MRARSSGMRSLDDLMFTMLVRLKSGQSYDSAAWSNLVNSELGTDGRTQYQAMVAGELGIPLVLMGFALPDSRIHAPNENLDLPTALSAAVASARFLAAAGGVALT